MLTKESNKPLSDPVEGWGPIIEKLPSVLFVFVLIFMGIAEATVVHGLWFKPRPSSYSLKLFEMPIEVLIPGFFGIAIRAVIHRQSKMGQISLPAASTLIKFHSALLVFTYIVLLDFIGIAFR